MGGERLEECYEDEKRQQPKIEPVFLVARNLNTSRVERRDVGEVQKMVEDLRICVPGWTVTLDYSEIDLSDEALKEFGDWEKVVEFKQAGIARCIEDVRNKLITLGYMDCCTRTRFRSDQMDLISKYLQSMSFYKTYKLSEIDLTLKDWQILFDFPDKTSDDFYRLLDLQLKDKVASFSYDEYYGTVTLKAYSDPERREFDEEPYDIYSDCKLPKFTAEQIELLGKYNPIVFKPIRDKYIYPAVVYRKV